MVTCIRKILSLAIIVSMLTTNFCWAVGNRTQDIETHGRTAPTKQIPLKTVKAAYKGDKEALTLIKERIQSHFQLTVQEALQHAQTLEAARSHKPSDEEHGTELRTSSSSSGKRSDEERKPLLESDERIIPAGLPPYTEDKTPSSAKTSLGSSPDHLDGSPSSDKSSPRDHSPRSSAGDPALGDESQYDEFFCESGDIPASLHAEARADKELPFDPEADQPGSLASIAAINANLEDSIKPEVATKMIAFLEYFERYVVENRTTWKQRGAMVAAVVASVFMTVPYSAIYERGIEYLIKDKLPLAWINDNEAISAALIFYVLGTSFCDVTGRHIKIFRDRVEPSQRGFSISKSIPSEIIKFLGGSLLALTPALMQLYFYVDVQDHNMETEHSHGISNRFEIALVTFGWACFLDSYTWSFDQISSFLGRAHDFLFKSSIPHSFKDSTETFREEMLKKLSAFKQAIFWAPRNMLEPIYMAIFDPALDNELMTADPEVTPEVKVVTKGLMRLQYILFLAKEFSFEKEETSASSVIVKGISTLMALAAAPMRFLTLQTVFSLMLKTFSGGYITENTADTISIPLAVLGSFPQGIAEFEGNVEFSELFSSHKPHHHSAYPALRLPGTIFSYAQGVFSIIPLLSLCVFETDEHFNGNLAILTTLSAPFLFPEFTSSVVALSQTYAQSLPYLIGRLGMSIARKFGVGTLTSEMRDELIRIVEGLERLVMNLSPELIILLENK